MGDNKDGAGPLLPGGYFYRDSVIANTLLNRARSGLAAMCDLLGEAQIFPDAIDGSGHGSGVICLAGRSLSLQFGNYRAEVVIVEDTFVPQAKQGDGEGPQVGVRPEHLRIVLQLDAQFVGSTSARTDEAAPSGEVH